MLLLDKYDAERAKYKNSFGLGLETSTERHFRIILLSAISFPAS